MVARFASLILVLVMAVVSVQPATAQNGSSTASSAPSGARKQLAIIVMAGIAGAVLGLSTLSFYGRPQDHLDNIAGGFAVGIIAGAGYSAYSIATKPHDFSRGAQLWPEDMDQQSRPRFAVAEPPKFRYALHF